MEVYDEEESMELSGESNLLANLHNFRIVADTLIYGTPKANRVDPDETAPTGAVSSGSTLFANTSNHVTMSFDVSWSTFSHDPSPPIARRADVLSPARFIPTPASSTPHQRAWKSLTLDQHHPRELASPTVKVSQKTCKSYFQTPQKRESPKRQSYSPMELEHEDESYGAHTESNSLLANVRKRFSLPSMNPATMPSRGSPMKTVGEYSSPQLAEEIYSPRESKKYRKKSMRKSVNNNNIKGDFDLEDSVFESEPKTPTCSSKAQRPEGSGSGLEKKSDKKSSVFVMLLVVLVSGCIGVYLYLQVDSCAVFDIDVVKLRHKLEDNVYGQHIAVKSVLDSLMKFEKGVKSGSSVRTLVVSFHGWTGVGKNYISKFVSEAFYNARQSLYLIPLHFAHVDIKDGLVEGWILGNITKCGVNVLIFDEIDKATVPLLGEIQSALETIRQNQNEEKEIATIAPIVVVIFISNSKSNQINQFLFSQLVNDRERELIRFQEFELIFDKSTGEWFEGMKSRNLIDYFIPFFPLAESHVKECIIKEFVKRGRDPDDEMVHAVMDELSFFDMGGHNGQMSLTGCKRVHDKVDLHIDD